VSCGQLQAFVQNVRVELRRRVRVHEVDNALQLSTAGR